VERLIGLGATRYPREYRPDDDFVVLEDPDGNRFCVVQVPEKDWAILQRSHLARVRAVGAGLLLVCGGLARRCRAR
jgi:glyoxalase superfamily protein